MDYILELQYSSWACVGRVSISRLCCFLRYCYYANTDSDNNILDYHNNGYLASVGSTVTLLLSRRTRRPLVYAFTIIFQIGWETALTRSSQSRNRSFGNGLEFDRNRDATPYWRNARENPNGDFHRGRTLNIRFLICIYISCSGCVVWRMNISVARAGEGGQAVIMALALLRLALHWVDWHDRFHSIEPYITVLRNSE